MTSDRIDELIALAALGELTGEEQRELDGAIAQDPQAAAELDEALAAAALIQRQHAEEPPAALRHAVLAAVASVPQEQAEPIADPVGGSAGADRQVASLDAERSRRRFRPMLLAAAVVALFAVGGVVLVATNDDSSADMIAAVVDAPDATARSLIGELDGLTVTYSASEGAVVVEGDGVPVLDDATTYQLWLIGDDSATSVGIFRPEADGTVSVRFPEADPTGVVLGVTQEPAGGSDSPTLPILAQA